MDKKRIAAILNRRARRNRKGALDEAKELLESESIDAQVFVTDGPELPETLKKVMAGGYDVVAAGGGDGTLNAVAGAVAGTDAAFAAIPLGTLNHFVRDAGIPLNFKNAIQSLRSGETAYADIGAVNEAHFINNSSVGIYPWMNRVRARLEGRGASKLKALVAALTLVVRRVPEFHVRMKAGEKETDLRTPFVFVGSGRYEMSSLRAWKRESLADGVLTVCVLHDRSRFGFIKLALAAVFGRLRLQKEFDVIGLTELVIDMPGNEADVALDGEVRRLKTPLHYRIIPKGLKMIVPRDYKE